MAQIKDSEIALYTEEVQRILVSRHDGPFHQMGMLHILKIRFMEGVEPLATEPQYRRFAEAMIEAEKAIHCRINN